MPATNSTTKSRLLTSEREARPVNEATGGHAHASGSKEAGVSHHPDGQILGLPRKCTGHVERVEWVPKVGIKGV